MSCTTQRKQIHTNKGHLFKEIWQILAEHCSIKPHLKKKRRKKKKTVSNPQIERRKKKTKSRLACCDYKRPVCRSRRTLNATALFVQSATFPPASTRLCIWHMDHSVNNGLLSGRITGASQERRNFSVLSQDSRLEETLKMVVKFP